MPDFQYLSRGENVYKWGKAKSLKYVNDGLYLAPHTLAGPNLYAKSTPGCRAMCLFIAGRGGMMPTWYARVRRTQQLLADRAGFVDLLCREIELRAAWAARRGFRYCFRPNGTSDLPWLAEAIHERLPHVQLYDYTKLPMPWKRVHKAYSLTFSRSESNWQECTQALRHGINVAVVFSTKRHEDLSCTYSVWPVYDGDQTDLRFLDPQGVIVGLHAKGKARRDTSGFVVQMQQDLWRAA